MLTTLLAILWSSNPALAQDYRFPSTVEQWDLFYPTAYYDHGGVDWNCGSMRYDGHRGNDFGGGGFTGMDAGRDIVAAADGEVIASHDGEWDRCTTGDCAGGGGFGNYVRIVHADGKDTAYAHLRQWSVEVSVGDQVTCGQKLGQMGSSGYSTGPHLHFAVRTDTSNYADPFYGDCNNPPSWWVDQWIYDEKPMPYCDGGPPACEPVATLACGASIAGRNDDPGASEDHLFYGCTDFAYTGPEQVWRFGTTLDETVTIDLTGLGDDLDLYLLEDLGCDGEGCLDASTNSAVNDEQLVFDAEADTVYVVVIDGWERAVTEFHLDVTCSGDLPEVLVDDTGDTATDDSGDTSGPTGPGDRTDPDDIGGCGCGGTTAPGTLAGLLAAAAILRRRRRRSR